MYKKLCCKQISFFGWIDRVEFGETKMFEVQALLYVDRLTVTTIQLGTNININTLYLTKVTIFD